MLKHVQAAIFDTTLDYSDHDWVDPTVCYISSYLQPKNKIKKYLCSLKNKGSKISLCCFRKTIFASPKNISERSF